MEITRTVRMWERLRSSSNGNPRYRLLTNDGNYITQSDASFAYGLDNSPKTGGLPLDVPVILQITRDQRVYGWRKIEE